MNGFILRPQKLKCPKCGKTEITTVACAKLSDLPKMRHANETMCYEFAR
nr:hypothetical protein [uncultured Campylobacter sp.]